MASFKDLSALLSSPLPFTQHLITTTIITHNNTEQPSLPLPTSASMYVTKVLLDPSILTNLSSNMLSTKVKERIDDFIDEVFDATFERTHGVAAMIWQAIVEEDFGAGGQALRAEIAAEIGDKVAAEGERVLDNTRELKAHITEIILTKVNNKVEEDFSIPLRAWASRRE
jgi:hypothetical protein